MSPPRYPSDLSNEEWAILESLLSRTERRGRPPRWPTRRVVETTRVSGPEQGYDGAKRLAGQKRRLLLVDTNGLVLAARVHGADLCPTGTAGDCWSRAYGKNYC